MSYGAPGHARRVEVVPSTNPGPDTLARMGITAREAARSWTLRQWAARLATRARPKDYRGQLGQLYAGIVDRWRYVLEDGEWIHGTSRSLLGTVLGLDYNQGPHNRDPLRADVERTPSREKGWGDCDDVATLGAAGILSLGMRPMFRVSRGPTGQAHVSVSTITPHGELVHLDPVGHPEHKFGWAQAGPGIDVNYYSLEGQPLESFGATTMPYAIARPIQPGPQFTPTTMIGHRWSTVPMGFGAQAANESTYLGVLSLLPRRQGRRRAGLTPYQMRVRRHLVAVSQNDARGARVLAVPGWHARAMMSGCVIEGCPAVDQYGAEYVYSQPLDLWVPARSNAAGVAMAGYEPVGYGAPSKKARRKARRRKALKKVGRFFKKIGQGIRKVFSKIMGSKFVQTIVAGILQVYGVPFKLTKKLLAVAAKFVGKGGFIKLFKSLRKHPKKALKVLAKTVAAAGRHDLVKGMPGMSGPGGYETLGYEIQQHGHTFYAAPVEGICGLDGAFGAMGEGAAISATPQGGYFYRIKKGDNLTNVAKAAYGKANPGMNWISQSAANQYATKPPKNDYEAKYIGDRVVSFLPQYSDTLNAPGPGNTFALIWIPPVKGVEPAVVPDIPDAPVEDEDDAAYEDEPDEPSPGPVPVPPTPADDDDLPPEEDDLPPPPPPSPPPVPVTPVREKGLVVPANLPHTEPRETGLKPIPWPEEDGGDPSSWEPTPSGPQVPEGGKRYEPFPREPSGPQVPEGGQRWEPQPGPQGKGGDALPLLLLFAALTL